MKHFLKLYRESRIVHKMIKRILLVGIICLGLTVLLYYQFYWNNLKHTAVNNSISTNLEIANQINANIENLTDTSQYIVNSADLMNKLSMYYREPGDYYSNDINLMLSGLISSMHNIRAVYIDGPDDMQFHSLDSLWPEDIEQLSSDNYQEVHDHNRRRILLDAKAKQLRLEFCFSGKLHCAFQIVFDAFDVVGNSLFVL